MSKINKLTQAIIVGDAARVESIIENAFFKKYLINKIDSNGYTPLTVSLIYEEHKIMEYLVKNGADVNKPDAHKLTPLAISIIKNRYYIFNKLIHDMGADFYKKVNKKTLINIAIQSNSLKIFNDLLNLGFSLTNDDLLTAIKYGDDSDPAIINIFLENLDKYKLNLNYENEDYFTPIKFAILFNKLNILKILIDSGKTTVEDSDSWFSQTPLEMALSENNLEAVKILISSKISKFKSIYPFKKCIFNGNLEMFKYLLDEGLDPNLDLSKFKADRIEESSFLEIAVKAKKPKMINLIIEYQNKKKV